MSDNNFPEKQNAESRMEKARAFSEKVRKAYKKAYDKAMEAGKERFDEIVKAGEGIEPRIRSAIDHKIQSAHAVIDGLNQSLADKTIPKIRRKSVSEEEKQNTEEK